MFDNTRTWRVLAGGVAAGVAGVVGFAGATASADPVTPLPAEPAPVTVTQTVTVAPSAAAAPTATPSLSPEIPTTVVAAPATVAATPTALPLTPAGSGTLADFFKDKGVALEPQNPRDFRALSITLPMPTGWTQVPDPNVPDAFAVIADRNGGDGLYTSNAQVVVYKLVGEFDPLEAITHGFVDSQQLSNWQTTDASLTQTGGFPSSLIEGAYRENDMILNTSRRHTIATVGPDHYLVSLSVTTAANQAVAAAPATDAIVNGFRVSNPAPVVTPAPAAPAAPAAPIDPAAAPAPIPVS